MTARHQLNAKGMKKALKCYGIKVLRCAKGSGSLRDAVNIVVVNENLTEVVSVLNELGVVGSTGKPVKIYGTVNPKNEYFDFGSCYMSDEIHKEINGIKK